MLQLYVSFTSNQTTNTIIYKYKVPLLQRIKITKSYSNKAILLKAFIHSDTPLKMKFTVLGNTYFRFLKMIILLLDYVG